MLNENDVLMTIITKRNEKGNTDYRDIAQCSKSRYDISIAIYENSFKQRIYYTNLGKCNSYKTRFACL